MARAFRHHLDEWWSREDAKAVWNEALLLHVLAEIKRCYFARIYIDGILHCRAFVELCGCVTKTAPMSLHRFRGALFGAGLEA